jgi:hypothetical protein
VAAVQYTFIQKQYTEYTEGNIHKKLEGEKTITRKKL